MQSALWKTAALVSVIGISGFVVVKVHDQLQLQSTAKSDADEFLPLNAEDQPAGEQLAGDNSVELGRGTDNPSESPFALPVGDQYEPGADEGASGFAATNTGDAQSGYSASDYGGGDSSNPFQMANAGEPDPETSAYGAADPINGQYDPFAGDGIAPDNADSPPAEFSTADARLAGGPQDRVEQVAGALAEDDLGESNPFAGPGLDSESAPPTQLEPTTDNPGALIFPDQPDGLDAGGSPTPAPGPDALPELSFDPPEADPSGNPFAGASPIDQEAGAPLTASSQDQPFGQEFETENQPTDDGGPSFDFGDPVDPQVEPVLPEGDPGPTDYSELPVSVEPPAGLTEPATEATDPTANFGPAAAGPLEPAPIDGLPEPAWPSEADPTAESSLGGDPENTFEPGALNPVDLVPENALEPVMQSIDEPAALNPAEPAGFPAAADGGGLYDPFETSSDASPLPPPAAADPLPEVRPLNPGPVPGAPGMLRPEFVGDGTLSVDAPAGPQQPELTIQKLAPPDATVGDPLVYAIRVKNVGNSTAHDVIVEDKIPRGTNLQGSIPQAELIDKRLIWELGKIEPGDEETIRIKVVPTEAGEVGSVATVRFVAEVAATTRITMPSLAMQVQGPGEVAVGEQVVFRFQISNNGDGEARNVYIRNLLPEGFEHPGGNDIEYDVGLLGPGQSRSINLAVTAAEVGQHALRAQLNTGTTVRDESTTPVNVIKSRLLIQRQGPKRRFVGRPAAYMTIVSNRSSRPLQHVEVVESLPTGMELAAAPEGGQYDPQRRTITWRIAELPPGGAKTLKTNVIASRQGVLQGSVTATDAAGNQAVLNSELHVAGFASLKVDLDHNGRPVGVGESVAMQLTVRNRGTGAAEQVEALFDIPAHLEFVNAEGPVQFEQRGRTVRFAALDELAANEERTFKIVLTAAAPGNTPVLAQLSTADLEGPLQQAEAVIVEGDTP